MKRLQIILKKKFDRETFENSCVHKNCQKPNVIQLNVCTLVFAYSYNNAKTIRYT